MAKAKDKIKLFLIDGPDGDKIWCSGAPSDELATAVIHGRQRPNLEQLRVCHGMRLTKNDFKVTTKITAESAESQI